MFTGLIEATARVRSNHPGSILVELPPFDEGAELGASISINGVCLTVTEVTSAGFRFDVSKETSSRTGVGDLRARDIVNIERALKLSDRIGGHFVTGHVDGLGKVKKTSPSELTVSLPDELIGGVVEKGSIAIDGISLTIAAIAGSDISAAIVPHTYDNTNLKARKPGDTVNIETDIIGKHVARLSSSRQGGITMNTLRAQGF